MEPQEILARCPLFSAIDAQSLLHLAEQCTPVTISSGTVVCKAGDPADALYIVATGRLRALLRAGRTPVEIGRLESVGEIGVFSGGVYSGTVRAVRDTMVLRIDRARLLEFVATHPSAMLAITREIIVRLRSANLQRERFSTRQHRAFAVIPANLGVDITQFTERLQESLSMEVPVRGMCAEAVDAALGAGASKAAAESSEANTRIVAFLDAVESETADGYLVYRANREADAWSRRCMRQADRLIVVADAGDLPMLTPMIDGVLQYGGMTPIDLVLLRDVGQAVGDISAWHARLETKTHYFVRPDSAGDHDSLARQLTGRGLGLVLGGGGARGFGHLGLLRALEELDIPVDLAGGSSMGAFMAALMACGFDTQQMQEITRETFVDRNYLNDFILPRVSLIRGRKLLDRLREVFGERQIETLRMPYFCVTTSLTSGAGCPHHEGELALWVGASMAVPGIAPPLVWHGELHVDGSVVNSLPTDVMQSLGRGPIVASDVSTVGALAAPGIEGPDPEALFRRGALKEKISLFDILFSTATLTSETGVKTRAARADCYLRMPLDGVGMFDWKRIDDISESSYAYAMEHLEPVRDILLSRAEPPEEIDPARALP